MKLPKQHIELATCKEQTRFTLNDVYLDAEKKICVATDGHLLAIVPVETEAGDVSGMIPQRAFTVAREALKRVKPKLRDAVRTSIQTLKKIIVRAPYHGETTVMARPVAQFPKFEQLLPVRTGAADVCFDLDYLNTLVKALQLPGDRCGHHVHLWIDKTKQPSESQILVSVGSGSAEETRGFGILMPVRACATAEVVLASIQPKAKAAKEGQ